MIKNKKVLAIIPARGGSKRLPMKNIEEFKGRPLITWSILAATGSSYIDKVIVSTDCETIGEVAVESGAEVPFMRPSELASDYASSNDVILHAIGQVADIYDYIVVLQPTSPLRTPRDIDGAIETLASDDSIQGVVSVCTCEHSPLWANSLPVDLNMGEFFPKSSFQKRSQDLPEYFRLNGSLYAYSLNSFTENKGIYYNEHVKAYIMPIERSIDIDTIIDFKVAEVLAEFS